MLFSLTESITLVSENTGTDNNVLVSKWLEETKAANGTYRPYFVIGMLLWLKPENNLIKGEGAEFNQNIETSKRYLVWQQAIDAQYKLVIPDQYICSNLLDQIAPTENRPSSVGFIAF